MSRFTSYNNWEKALRDMNEAKDDAERAVPLSQWDGSKSGPFAIRIADGLGPCRGS